MSIIENHTVLKPPKENYTLWRYMDIPSFLSLLAESALVFVRADLFEDKYEGHFTKPTAKLIDEFASSIKLNNDRNKSFSQHLRDMFNNVYLNCWCIGQHEVIHMWKIYSKVNGIAIKTNYSSLKQSITDNQHHDVLPGIIQYVDRENDFVDYESNTLQPYTIKGQEYKYENEFRLIISGLWEIEQEVGHIKNVDERNKARIERYQKIPVIKLKVNLSEIIKDIYISPYAPVWYKDFIEDILPRYGIIDPKITQSNL
ncbi:MAG: hypothetical protein PHU27_05245 [Salinivirgaceae bacterium]|nr:hypothetical protein [Salinivirgaceae bacterium]MDD4747383.1 hypothetical protein [Salinivirgaceae bacterium]